MNENTILTKNKLKKHITKKLEWDFNVPDNKSDILKIVSPKSEGFITDCELKDGTVTARVTIKANMLYIPDTQDENEMKLSSLETSESFTMKVDIPEKGDWDISDVKLIIKGVSDELINSRKASVKAMASLCVTLIKNKELCVKIPEEIPTESRKKSVCAVHIPVYTTEKISFTHTFSIPNGKPDIREILRCCAQIKNKELKTVTGKAVFKGNLVIKILYASKNNTVECFETNMPFTEITDAKGLSEDMETIFSASPENVTLKVFSGNESSERTVEANGTLMFNLMAFKKNEIDIVCDAFCPGFEYDCTMEELNYSDISKCLRDAHTLKENITLSDSDIIEICDISADIINKEAIIENGKINITSEVIYDIVYKSPSGIKCERKTSNFDFIQDAPEGDKYDTVDISSEITNISFMISSGNSVEVRCNILFETHLSKENSIRMVTEVKSDKSRVKNSGRAPIVAYYPNENESLFEIAKKYGTTVQSLKEVNSLPGDTAEKGKYLIIE